MSRRSYTTLWWIACACTLMPVLWVMAYGLNRAYMSGAGPSLGDWLLGLGPALLLISAGVWMSRGRRRGLIAAAVGIGIPGVLYTATLGVAPEMVLELGAGALTGLIACYFGLTRKTRGAFH